MENSYQQPPFSKIAIAAFVISIIGAAVFTLSGYGYQWGWWGLGTGFGTLIPAGAILGIVALLLTIIYPFIKRGKELRGLWMVIVAVVLGLAIMGNAGYWYYETRIQHYPPIHDITTDTVNPPQFKAVVPLRANAANPTKYGGQEIAQLQKEYYPDIKTLILNIHYSQAFDKALSAARSTSWDLVDYNKQEGRIEATHTLPWFGFKDDIVIRIDTAATDSNASSIDVRSVSRIGRGDIGVNAARVRGYLNKLK